MYIKRAIDGLIERYARTAKCLLVTGPRQVGKSTSLGAVLKDRKYVSLDDPFAEEQAKEHPSLFMELNPPPVTIDEVQQAPGLFRYLKMACDEAKDGRGLFCLSGSQPYHLMKGVSESLSGRVRIVEMCGLSLRELAKDGFSRHFVPTEEYVRVRSKSVRKPRRLWEVIHRGGYPELQRRDVEWNSFYADYVKTYLERDVRALSAVHSLTDFRRFMVSVASRTGQVLNSANIASEIGKDAETVRNWLSILETSGIVYLLQPYAATELKRAIKSPKVYFRDAGLAAYLTRWLTPETLATGAMSGHVFETFAVSEILKSYANEGLDYRNYVSYYRGKDRRRKKENGEIIETESEIDLILEENGTLYPVEIKLTDKPTAKDAAAFTLLDRVTGKIRGPGAVICTCPMPGRLRDNLMALPIWFV